MANTKKVELIEGRTLAITDCGENEANLFDIDCGCDDGVPGTPPPIIGENTACRVSTYVSSQVLNWFATFIPALTAYGTPNFVLTVKQKADEIGLGTYWIGFHDWITRIGVVGQLNRTISEYYVYERTNRPLLGCLLLGCLSESGEIDLGKISCWRAEINASLADYPTYDTFLEDIADFIGIIPISTYKELAVVGSLIASSCDTCQQTPAGCSPGQRVDWRQVSDLQGWEIFTGNGSLQQFPTDTTIFNANSQIVAAEQVSAGIVSPGCASGICPTICIRKVFSQPLTLCSAYLDATGIRDDLITDHVQNTISMGIFYKQNGVVKALTQKKFGYVLSPGVPREVFWGLQEDPIPNVSEIYMLTAIGGSRSRFRVLQYNEPSPVSTITTTGLPYVAKPRVIVPANVTQAGFDAIFATESAGRIYELEGTLNNLRITPRAGDVFRPKFGKIARLYGGQVLTGWTLDQGTTYWTPYTRVVNKAGAGGNGLVNGTYQINDDANFPRAHWMIMLRQGGGAFPTHVASLANCRANVSTYFYDDAVGRIYINLGSNPSATTIEVTHTQNAFVITANGITLENLEMDLYAPNFQEGIVQTGSPLTVGETTLYGCKIDASACNGAKLGTGSKILENEWGYSGMTSIVFQGNEVTVSGNVQTGAYNIQHTNEGFEAAFLKSSRTVNAIISGNILRLGGDGKGLWDDLGCAYTLYVDNVIQDCQKGGIMTELAFGTRIIKNRVIDCQRGETPQPQRGEILVVNTQGWGGNRVLVSQNTIVNFGDGGGMWGLNQSSRGTGTAPDGSTVTYLTKDVDVVDNDFYCRDTTTGSQRSGTYQDYNPNADFNTLANGLVADNNRYHMSSANQHFQQAGANLTWTQWRALTALVADPNSTIDQASVPAEVDA